MGGRDVRDETQDGRLTITPARSLARMGPGLHALGLDRGRDALIYMPRCIARETSVPLVLSLHGAGGNDRAGLLPLRPLAEAWGFALLSPASRGRTWDAIRDGFGPDVAFLSRMMSVAFERCPIDRDRLAISGFSDGASYALSLGIANGDLFHAVLGFSPGFIAPGAAQGRPRFYISHGRFDQVLDIDRTSRRVVRQLRQVGYDVEYREFDGTHMVPPEIAQEAVVWWLEDS